MITTQVLVPITAVTMTTVTMTPEGQARRDRLLAKRCCLGCERSLFENEQTRCGQCDTCYQASRLKIRQGVVRLKDLIRDGFMLVPSPGGRPPKNPYTRRLAGG
jgi:hypothetical protein